MKTLRAINSEYILNQLEGCPDIIKKKVILKNYNIGYFIYVNGLIDSNTVYRDFISPIIDIDFNEINEMKVLNNLNVNVDFSHDSKKVIQKIMAGDTVFICDGLDFAIACSLTKPKTRSIEEPVTEKNIRGSHEGFIESLEVNLSILRRNMRNEKLKFKIINLGQQTNQNIAIAYIEGVADIDIVNSLFEKINNIETDGLSTINYVEQSIKSHSITFFPQFLSTERIEKTMASLLEGRIAILQEGTPVATIAPINFISFFQALDDYSISWVLGSFLRIVRLTAVILAVILPSLYIAVIEFHYYVVPLKLLIPIAQSRAKVPFPPLIEVLILEAIVEIIREAAIRLPTYIGTAISVFASLVIGQATVEAGIVSNILIIIVAASAVASYVVPSYEMAMAIRLLRFAFTIFAAIFGIMGIVICAGFTMVHLVSIESLGQPYFQPYSPLSINNLKDSILRFPLNKMKKRPVITNTRNQKRGEDNNGGS